MGLKDVPNIDYKKKENQTLTNWFWYCIYSLWIPIITIGFILLVLELTYLSNVISWIKDAFDQGTGIGCFVAPFSLIPLGMVFLTAYKGLYQDWNDVCGKS